MLVYGALTARAAPDCRPEVELAAPIEVRLALTSLVLNRDPVSSI